MSIFFFYPILRALSNGRIIRASVAIGLRVLAVLSVLCGGYLLVELLKVVFQPQVPTEAAAGGLLFGLIFLAAVLAVGQIFWYRADSVRDLGDSPFTAIPIVSILFRAAGEVYATVGASVAVGGCLFIWFARAYPYVLLGGLGGWLPSTRSEPTFLGGLSFLGYVGLVSFLMLIFFYFLAESIVVMADIAVHVRLLAGQGQASAPPAPAAAAPAPVAPPPMPVAAPRCPRCFAELEPGTQFCGTCGNPIAG
jgi:hypothetical protein